MFSQSCVKVSASLTNVGSLAVGAFDLVNCSLSYVTKTDTMNVFFTKTTTTVTLLDETFTDLLKLTLLT